MLNVKLNPAYVVPNAVEFEKQFRACVQLEQGVEDLKGDLWGGIVSRIAKDGIVNDPAEMLARLAEFEAIAQTIGGPEGPVERKRAARKGVASTGYVTPDTFKTYKSVVKRAVLSDVELLDADGIPRSVGDVLADLEAVKPEKSAIDKLVGATDTWIKILAHCDTTADKARVAELVKIITDAAAAFDAS